jgi:plastocyanin
MTVGRVSRASRAISVALTLAAAGAVGSARAAGDDTGTIEGRVSFSGDPPPPVIVFEGGGLQPVLHLGERRGLRYAVAFLADSPPEPGIGRAAAMMGQVGFVFEPQVLAVREGQAVTFTNEDGANHSVRGEHALTANRLDAYTGAGQSHTHNFRADPAGRPVAVTCRVHPWMAAWIYVFPHSRFAVTDARGGFRIERVPAGAHRLAIRHAAGGLARDLAVRVAAGAVSTVDVVFETGDLESPSPP